MNRMGMCFTIWLVILMGCGRETPPAPSLQPDGNKADLTSSEEKEETRQTAAELENQTFEALVTEYLGRSPTLSPIHATWLGDHRFDAEVDEVTDQARKKKLNVYRDWLKKLAALDKAALTKNNHIDFMLLTNHLKYSIWAQETLREWEWNPLVYTDMTGSGIYNLMAREFAPLPERLARVTDRLEKYSRLFEQIRATLKVDRIPKIHAEVAVRQNRGVLDIIDQMVRPHIETLSKEAAKRLQGAIDQARTAVDQHQQWLEQEVLPKAKGDFRIGAELYDKKLAFTLNAPLSRKEIREQAENEIRRVHKEMYRVAKALTQKKDTGKALEKLPSPQEMNQVIRAGLELAYKETPGKDEILDVAKKALQLTQDFVREKDLVTIPPDPIELIVMPEFKRGIALAYCDAPGPLDAGQKTFYAVSPMPEHWTPKQVTSYLREYNLRSVYNLTIHEAMPGHYLQLTHANAFPSKLRAVLASGSFIEGWAVYTERVMWENGFLDKDPLMQLIVQKWYLRAVVNAIIDQEVHTGNITEAAAMKLMTATAFQEEREAAGKWTRARLTSAQLTTYFVGYLEHSALRRDVETAWGKDFSLKKYHDKVLSYGSPPVRFVRALILDQPISI